MNFIIAQIMGILSTFSAILCVQARSAAGILLGQILANVFSGASYGLLDSPGGAWLCIIAAVHSLIVSFINKLSEGKRRKAIIAVSLIFTPIYLAVSVLTYSRWTDIISGICALLFVFTIAQKDAGKMRNVMLLSMSLWVVYDIAVGAYTNVITHGSTIVSILGAKLRLDRAARKL